MLIRLSQNTFVRNYGNFTYVLHKLNAYDEMFDGAEVFMRWITREPREKAEILKNICGVYTEADPAEITADFEEFIAPMIAAGAVLAGNTPAELDAQEVSFRYDMPNPKTERDTTPVTKEEAEKMPQIVLKKYFEEHPTLFDIQLDITQACTERCIHCYVPDYNPLFLPYEKICEVVDEFREMGGLHVGLSGGECMLHPDFEKIVRYIRSKDCTCGILSNLTLCDDKKVELLKEMDCGVQVSLYSMDPEIHDSITRRKGSWLETKTAIEKLYKANVPVTISCPTMRKNFEGYLEVMKYAESMHMFAQTDFIMMAKADHDSSNLVNRLTLPQTKCLLEDIILRDVPMMKEYFNPDVKDELQTPEERAEQRMCGAGTDKMCLNADGNYYACSGFQDFPLGNCFKQSLRDVWENSPQIKYLRGLRGKDIPKCIHCKNRNYCSMCLVRNFNETGDMLKVAEHFCKVAALNHQIVDELHARLAKEYREEHRK